MRTSFAAVVLTLALAVPALAQQPPQPQPAQQPIQRVAPAPLRGDLANIRVELAISDTYTTSPASAPSTKTVTLLVMDGERGIVRTSNRLASGAAVELNVDTQASVMPNGAIRLHLTFEYTPAQAAETGQRAQPAQLTESLTVVFESGRKLMVSQSADPATDRRVTVEVTATVVK